MKHSPGPWWINEEGGVKSTWGDACPKGSYLVYAKCPPFALGETVAATSKKADAHLIAAAPELEEAVKLQQQAIEELMREFVSKKGAAADWSIINDAGIAANAALFKARGLSKVKVD